MKNVHIKDICIKGSSALKQKDLLTEGKFPVYGAGGIVGYLDTFHQEKTYIGIIKDGSGIGRVDFYPEKTSLIGTLQYILPRTGYDIRYIGYCLQSLDLSKYKQGAAIPHIYFRDYGERIVNVTEDVKEQQSIVSRLDSAFAKIDAVKANAENQLSDAKALFQKELSKAMMPKEGWERKKLGEVSSFQNGFAFKSNLFRKEGHPIVRISNIQDEEILTDDIVYFNKEDYPVNFDNYKIYPNDILIAMSGGTTGKLGINTTNTIFYQNQRVGVIREDSNSLNHRFLFFFLLTKSKESLKIAAGAAQPNLSTAQIKDFAIPVPPLSEQQAIVSHLDTLSEKLKAVEEKQKTVMAECDAMKQALLREVFE